MSPGETVILIIVAIPTALVLLSMAALLINILINDIKERW